MEKKEEAPVATEEKKEEEKQPAEKMEDVKKYEEGMPISGFVKKELVDMLMSCGFSKTVSEKALYLTGGTSTDKALEWIEKHQEDPDFEEELRIVGQEEKPAKPTMSDEEARKKARELQEQIRKRRKEKEEQLEREREKERLKGTKALAEAKQKLEEATILREAEKRRKEKLEAMRAMKQMEEQLLRDKEERFGKKFTASGKSVEAEKQKSPIQRAQHAVKMIKELYPEDRHPDVAANCMKMLKAYVGNLAKDPTNEKFKRINKENPIFKERVGSVQGGIIFLKAVGFEDKITTMEIDKVDVDLAKAALALLD